MKEETKQSFSKKSKGYYTDVVWRQRKDGKWEGRVELIPMDYEGPMGVPVTFIDKHNPYQFEIIGHIGSVGADGIYSFANAIYLNKKR